MIQKSAYIKFVVLFLLMTGLYGCTDHSNEPANATENPNTTQDETTSEYTEETTELPEGVAYIMEDGSSVLIDSLLKPVQTYNRICLTADADSFTSVFPDEVIAFNLEAYDVETIADYASKLNSLYVQIYSNDFAMSNEYVACSILSESQLEDFIQFYADNVGADIVPEYAFIVESEYTITYTDEAGEEQSDCDTDYYIAYFYDGMMYLDYYYIDTLDL